MSSERAAGAPSLHKGAILALACLGQFMVVLDVAIVNVALPAMQRDLDFSGTGLQWVVNAYTLTFAGFMLLGGRAADLYGRRRLLILGLVLFSAASLVCAVAQGPGEVIAARAVQGLGAAVLSPATLTIVTTTFTESKERARALGLWSASLAAGGATGGLIGGLLTDLLSWRWIFLINLPIGVGGILVARVFLPESRRPEAARSLDVAGALTVTAGLTALVYGVVRSEEHGWTSAGTLACLVGAAALIAAFLVVEMRVATAPLVPLGRLRSRALAGANLTMFCVGASMFAMWYFVSLYLQEVLGHSPLRAGVEFLPAAIAVIVGAQVSGRLLSRLGPRPLMAGATLLCAGGLLWMSGISASGDYASEIAGPLTLVALGLGLSFPPGTYAATADMPPRDAGLASGLVNATRQIGGAVGLAALATIAVDHARAVVGPGAPSPAELADAATQGYSRAFLVAAFIALAASLASLVVPSTRPRASGAAAGAGEGERLG